MKPLLPTLFGIVALVILECVALSKGINGDILATTTFIIGVLAGCEMYRQRNYKGE